MDIIIIPIIIIFIIIKGSTPCRKRTPAKGVWQKGDKRETKIRKSDPKVTERVPKTKKSDRPPFADLLLRHPEFWIQSLFGEAILDSTLIVFKNPLL